MKRLIMIPGLGRWDRFYWLAAPWWWLRGYKVSVFSINWMNPNTKFDKSYQKLLEFIDNYNREQYLIGASAGGAAAILAFADRPSKIKRIAVIASPIVNLTSTKNLPLQEALNVLKNKNLRPIAPRVMSIYGTVDSLVDLEKSQLNGANQVQAKTTSHGQTLVQGLTLKSGQIQKFFSK